MSNTKESVIYNNFIQNPSIMGTAPSLADEQLNDLGEQIYVFSLDTIVEGGSVTMSNNNIHYTQDVLDHYATFDSVTKPNLYSPTFVQALTGDPADADFEEVLELEAVPSRDIVIQYAREAVQFKDSTGIANMMVEDSLFAIGTDYDRGYLFDFTRFSPCYDPTSQSATAGINGGAVGAVGAVYECDGLGTSTRQPVLNPQLRLTAMPNPAVNEISFTYETTQPGPVSFKLFDLTGKIVRNNLASNVQPGAHRLDFRNLSDLPGGTYIASLRTTEGRMFVKVIKQ
ncbi:MAG: T9SS type A sorting domain-containing protein [Bacteroidota bacterium]